MRFHPDETARAVQEGFSACIMSVSPAPSDYSVAPGEASPDAALWREMMAFGAGGIMVDQESGGSGMGLFGAALLAETAGRCAVPGLLAWQMLSAYALSGSAQTAPCRSWLPGVISGECVATLVFGGQWSPDSWDLHLKDSRLSGEARFVQGAGDADIFLAGTMGGGLVLVEAGPGVEVINNPSSDPGRGTGRVLFDKAMAIPVFPEGSPAADDLFDAALVLIAADALGGCSYCVDQSVAYAGFREQFGGPIGRFQGLKHQLADMALETEPSRSLVWYAAHAFDAGLSDRRRAAALAKAHLCDRYTSVSRAAIAAHGGIGYTWEHTLNARFRRALFDRAMLGSPAFHRRRAGDLAGW